MTESTSSPRIWGNSPIHVEDAGQGEIVVLHHSSGMSGEQWRRTAEHLAAVIA